LVNGNTNFVCFALLITDFVNSADPEFAVAAAGLLVTAGTPGWAPLLSPGVQPPSLGCLWQDA